ncbi:cell division protein FtsL [Thiomicrorhabdus sp. 6S3-12]|uniref:cell division protein FtsL n=1 Tax=Thiomicrorhabdus sp. 6S3-12 TaxID=2819681 RepID=UPI001FB7B988|nr:cell division protein FtsL [Thiomicrorhabdus sp. 6S3-12]
MIFLVLFLFALLFGNIYLSHQIRGIQKEYYKNVDQLVAARHEWGELMLEKMHLTSPANVERIAKEELKMVSSQKQKQTVYIVDKEMDSE